MVKREKALSVPGEYNSVFVAASYAAQALGAKKKWTFPTNFKIESADPRAGRIIARGTGIRLEVVIVPQGPQCIVTVRLSNSTAIADMAGVLSRHLDRYLALLVNQAAPLVSAPATLDAASTVAAQYAAPPSPERFMETQAGHSLFVLAIIICAFVCIPALLFLFTIALSMPR